MKKFISFALIAALVATCAFAGFTGNAALEFGYDLESSDYGFANKTTREVSSKINLDSGVVDIAGEGDLKAELAANFSIDAEFKKKDDGATATPTLAAEITKANIIYKDVTVDILGIGGKFSFAKTFWDEPQVDPDNDAKKKIYAYDAISTEPVAKGGFAVSYKDYTAGFGLNGNSKTGYFATTLALSTADIAVTEEVKVAGAAELNLSKEDKDAELVYAIYAGAKGDYAVEEGLSANVGADVMYADDTFGIEAVTKVAYAPVTVDGYVAYNTAKVAGETHNAVIYGAKASASQTIEAVTVGAGVGVVGAKVTDADAIYALTADVSASYKADMFTVSASLALMGDNSGDDFELTRLAPRASISSDAIISGATLSLTYADAEFKEGGFKGLNTAKTGYEYYAKDKGAITAACTIAF